MKISSGFYVKTYLSVGKIKVYCYCHLPETKKYTLDGYFPWRYRRPICGELSIYSVN